MILNESWREGLTDKQQALIVEFFIHGFRFFREVWENAGYKSARGLYAWLNTPVALNALKKFCDVQLKKSVIGIKARTAEIIVRMALTNPVEIIDSNGDLLPEYQEDLKEMGDLGYCIEGIETTKSSKGLVDNKTKKIKLIDRMKAIELLSKIYDFYGEREGEEVDGKKDVTEMTREERQKEIAQLLKRNKQLSKLIEDKRKKK